MAPPVPGLKIDHRLPPDAFSSDFVKVQEPLASHYHHVAVITEGWEDVIVFIFHYSLTQIGQTCREMVQS